MAGQYFEDLTEGWHVAHSIRRTVTDAEYAAGTEFGRVVVNSIFTFGLMAGISVGDTTLGTLVAKLGFDAVKFPKPAFVGGTPRTEASVVQRRPA